MHRRRSFFLPVSKTYASAIYILPFPTCRSYGIWNAKSKKRAISITLINIFYSLNSMGGFIIVSWVCIDVVMHVFDKHHVVVSCLYDTFLIAYYLCS
ncbi:hypothetical protein BDF19DRAFT_432746 [Syncephalis fuscata]|nr:hypothetical protein BDF19DRAFT_432746 [Syncephalis fuscata]